MPIAVVHPSCLCVSMRDRENCELMLNYCLMLGLYYVANGDQIVNVMCMTETQFLS